MITKEEQIQLFYNKYSNELIDLLYEIKKHCEQNGLPILNDLSKNHQADFIDLILENVNLKKMFLNHYKF